MSAQSTTHTAPDATLQSASFTWATKIQMTQCLGHVGITHTQLSLVAIVMVAIVSVATLG